jgi:hypothetical protein
MASVAFCSRYIARCNEGAGSVVGADATRTDGVFAKSNIPRPCECFCSLDDAAKRAKWQSTLIYLLK